MKKNHKGFTLIELVIVIAILAILAAVLIPQFAGFQQKARSSQCILDAKNVATAIDSMKAENGTYPTSSDADAVLQLAGLQNASGDNIERNGDEINLSLDAENDGGFTLTESVDPNDTTKTMAYGRDNGESAVVKK